ncbi:MAG: WD40/YVTN/BNR-like repeat-containing protein [Candidatus Thorarchaeota archaeon]
MNCIEIDPMNPNTLYAVGAGSDIFKSTNGGTNWTVIGTLPSPTPQITDLVISKSNPQTLYCLTVNNEGISGDLYRSTNGGVNWSRINYDPIHQDMSVFHFAIHPTNSSIIVAIMWNAFVFRTSDAGQTWVNVSGNLPREPDMTTYTDIAISGDNEY